MGAGPGVLQEELLERLESDAAMNPYPGLLFSLTRLVPDINQASASRVSGIRRATTTLAARQAIDKFYVFDTQSGSGSGPRWTIVLRLRITDGDRFDMEDSMEMAAGYRVDLIDHGHRELETAANCERCRHAWNFIAQYEHHASVRGIYLADDPRLKGEATGRPDRGLYPTFIARVDDARARA